MNVYIHHNIPPGIYKYYAVVVYGTKSHDYDA